MEAMENIATATTVADVERYTATLILAGNNPAKLSITECFSPGGLGNRPGACCRMHPREWRIDDSMDGGAGSYSSLPVRIPQTVFFF